MSQSFNASQSRGQTQIRNSQSFNARHSKDEIQARTGEWMEGSKGTTNEPSSDSAQAQLCGSSVQEHLEHSAHPDKQEPAGFLQQTGDKAHDAVDTVKET